MNKITISEIKDGDILFLHGTKFLAKRIQWFQKLRFGNIEPFKSQRLFNLNHVGFFYKTKEGNVQVYEQDTPGRFQASPFDLEYLKDKCDVYVGVPVMPLDKEKVGYMIKEAERIAGKDCFVNYSYKSFISFMADSFWHKLTGKDCWITKPPKGDAGTCSQVTAKFYQVYFKMFTQKEWWKFFPCELSASPEIELKKLVY